MKVRLAVDAKVFYFGLPGTRLTAELSDERTSGRASKVFALGNQEPDADVEK